MAVEPAWPADDGAAWPVPRRPPFGSDAERAEIAALAARIQAGEPELCAVLYARCLGRVRDFARTCVRDPREAEDLAQQVLARALEALAASRLEDSGTVLAWLSRMTHNAALDHLRKRARVELLEPGAIERLREEVGEPAPLGVSRWPVDDDLAAALRGLSELERQVVVLRYRLDLSLADVAAALGRSEDAVKDAQRRALERMRGRLLPLRSPGERLSLPARRLPWAPRRAAVHSFSTARRWRGGR